MTKRKNIDNVTSALDVCELGEIISYAGNLDRLAENTAKVTSSPTAYLTKDDKHGKYLVDYRSNKNRSKYI